MTNPSDATLPGAQHTMFRGYGPFVALLALIVAMALVAPTVAPEQDVTTRPAPPPATTRRSSATDGCCG